MECHCSGIADLVIECGGGGVAGVDASTSLF
jgi:hypothetical protein